MNPINITAKLTAFLLILLTIGCATSNSTQTNEKDEPLSLRQHLERLSGVTLSGSRENTKIQTRGSSSLTQTGHTQPLFVVDGNKMGRDFYFVASKLNPEDIKSVRFLQGAGANMYGSEGYQGVIVIKTTGRN